MQRIRDSLFFVTTTVLALVVRTLASIGQPVARFPDSAGYETLRLWGTVDRFWPVPLMYSILQSDVSRVVGHIVIGVAAWTWLAYATSRLSQWSKSSFAAIMLLGLTPQVIRYDIALLSESFGISFTVAAIAATMQVLISRTRVSLFVWAGAIVVAAMVRPTHLIILVIAVCVVAVSAIRTPQKDATIVAVVLTASVFFGLVQLRGHGPTSLLNFYTVLVERVMPNDDRYEWFIARGMPNIEEMRTASGYDYDYELPVDVAAIVALPVGQQPPTLMRAGGVDLARWADDDGWRHYVTYAVTHPGDTASRVIDLFDSTIGARSSEFLPLDNGPMIPWFVFQWWQFWIVLLGFGFVGHYFFSLTRRMGHIIMVMTTLAAVIYSATMLTSGIEHPRHAVTMSVVLRVLAIVSIATVSIRPKASEKTA